METVFVTASWKPNVKILYGTRGRLFFLVSVIVGLAIASCQRQEAQLRTVRYDNLYRSVQIATAGRGKVYQLVQFFRERNPEIDRDLLNRIARTYVDEAAAEGINSDVAFCQMAHETNFLRFGGDVEAWQNNFCGLGATGGGEPGLSFPSMRIGVRAHIQHLKAYANNQPLRRKLVDPRFGRVRRGRAPYVEDLTGTWATDPLYGHKLRRKLQALERYL